jgi:hypothetical protein
MSLIDGLTIEEDERFDEIRAMMEKNSSSPERPFWLLGHAGEYADRDAMCIGCIKELLPNREYGDNYDGGFACEEDDAQHCQRCGKLLEYTLTNEGVDYEMEGFAECPPDAEDLADPDTCYELARIAWGISSKEQALKFTALFPESFAENV